MGANRLSRMMKLLSLLQGGRARSAADLCEQLGISRRTLFRDLQMLEEAGVPYYHDRELGYRIDKGYFLPPVSLTVPETLGLMTLAKSLEKQKGRPYMKAAFAAVSKLTSTVPQPIREACDEMMARVSVAQGRGVDAKTEAEIYPLLQRCADEGRVCRMVYRSPVEAEEMTCEIRPYALHFVGRAWYLFGQTDIHDEVRVFKLARVVSIEAMDKKFTRPRGFSVEKQLGLAWQMIPEGKVYKVELEFSKRVATNVSEVKWHRTQKHRMLSDGRCVMTFEVDGINEIAWWVCGYADQVVVRKPVVLKERVKGMLAGAVSNYK